MSEFEYEKKDLLIRRSFDDYHDNAHKRVREAEMSTRVDYSFIAEFAFSKYGSVGEFQTRIGRIQPHDELGRTSLLLCLIDTDIDDTLIYLDATSEEGFITPRSRQRISHNRLGDIGIVEEGYLLGPHNVLTPASDHRPDELTSHAHWNGPNDTRTSALSLHGIHLSSD